MWRVQHTIYSVMIANRSSMNKKHKPKIEFCNAEEVAGAVSTGNGCKYSDVFIYTEYIHTYILYINVDNDGIGIGIQC